MSSVAVFDALAANYDERFTHSAPGRVLRHAVWRWLDRVFHPGARVLELNCGTGEDALHLARRGVRVLGTDISAPMVDCARLKIDRAGFGNAVDMRQLSIERIDELIPETDGGLDGAFSNFGGLNCVADLAATSRALATLLKPGARLVLCVMGPVVPWEWAWYLARGDVARAFRRLKPGGVQWRGMPIRYPSVRRVRRAFAEQFILRRAGGLGVLLPPTRSGLWQRFPRWCERLNRWERRVEEWPIVPWLGDHYLLELERT
jgi:SAM-dependent methyltransferase